MILMKLTKFSYAYYSNWLAIFQILTFDGVQVEMEFISAQILNWTIWNVREDDFGLKYMAIELLGASKMIDV